MSRIGKTTKNRVSGNYEKRKCLENDNAYKYSHTFCYVLLF